MGGHYKNIDGEVFGNYQIIGDTGKRDKKNNVVLIARNTQNGSLIEGSSWSFRKGRISGYRNLSGPQRKRNKLKNNKTGYQNIYFNSQSNRWEVCLIYKNKKHRKQFKKFKDAVIYNNKANSKNEEILVNDYVKDKQKIIDNSIEHKKPQGVSWNKRQQKWVAYITIDKKRKSLGSFTNKQQAIAARQEAVEKYFNQKGEF